MKRFLLAASLALTLASCGGAPASSPYSGNCTEYSCDGHLLSNY